jgi:Flp pilus assembly protein TadD
MGLAQTKMKMYDEAIVSFRKEQEESGDDSDIESALARAYEAKGMKPEAAEARKKAAELKNQ